MKILIINLINKYDTLATGGHFIVDRNAKFITTFFGENNTYTYSIRYYKNKIITFLNGLRYRMGGYKTINLTEIINIIKINNIDFVFIPFSSMGTLAKDLTNILPTIKVITFFHNCEFNYILDSIKSFSFIKKYIYNIYAKSLFNAEKNACNSSNLLITLNERDSNEIFKYYNFKANYILPTSFPDLFSKEKALKINEDLLPKTLLFVGYNFFGNTDGLFWFIENCLNKINARLIVVGTGMDKFSRKYKKYNVEFHGFAENLEYYYYKASAVVLPIISGSGMKTKTCEALMYGKYIFGSIEAFEGYNVDYNKIGGLCETKEDYINKINNFLEEKRPAINNYSRELFINSFSDDIVFKEFKSFLSSTFCK